MMMGLLMGFEDGWSGWWRRGWRRAIMAREERMGEVVRAGGGNDGVGLFMLVEERMTGCSGKKGEDGVRLFRASGEEISVGSFGKGGKDGIGLIAVEILAIWFLFLKMMNSVRYLKIGGMNAIGKGYNFQDDRNRDGKTCEKEVVGEELVVKLVEVTDLHDSVNRAGMASDRRDGSG
ncbi:unnamed protein product [Dovyalis caffra]|uniref:Glycine-rich protein n=1 Tax=Dovyalis caffra TaxID=77055 RepID=A0AAV1SN32_9ROSI|nr:unnamed protein product [Dovyalis caffra]